MGILKKPKKKKEPYMEYHRGFLNVDHLGFTRRFLIIAPYHPQVMILWCQSVSCHDACYI